MGLFIIEMKKDVWCLNGFCILCAFILHHPFLFAKLLGILQKLRNAFPVKWGTEKCRNTCFLKRRYYDGWNWFNKSNEWKEHKEMDFLTSICAHDLLILRVLLPVLWLVPCFCCTTKVWIIKHFLTRNSYHWSWAISVFAIAMSVVVYFTYTAVTGTSRPDAPNKSKRVKPQLHCC